MHGNADLVLQEFLTLYLLFSITAIGFAMMFKGPAGAKSVARIAFWEIPMWFLKICGELFRSAFLTVLGGQRKPKKKKKKH